jgi:hypothetical protein
MDRAARTRRVPSTIRTSAQGAPFDNGQLEVTHPKDSDGDSRYRLIVRDASKNRAFDSSLYDDAELVDCARWLEASTGFPLRLPR